MAGSYLGASFETIYGLILGLATLGFSIAFLATANKDLHWAVRWLVFFAIPMVGEIIHTIVTGVRASDTDPKRKQLMWLSLLHMLLIMLFVFTYVCFLRFGVEDWLSRLPEGKQWSSVGFWVLGGFWLLFITLLWLTLPMSLRDQVLPEPPPQ